MRSRRALGRALANALGACLLLAVTACAHAQTGTISGRVVDSVS